jgi:heme O synthase-like polyprenyltransferase
MLVNKIGFAKSSEFFSESDNLCGINLKRWYLYYTILVGAKLLLTAGKYYCLKRDRKEHIALYLIDLVLMNVLFSGLFIDANMMYFSDNNLCYYTND